MCGWLFMVHFLGNGIDLLANMWGWLLMVHFLDSYFLDSWFHQAPPCGGAIEVNYTFACPSTARSTPYSTPVAERRRQDLNLWKKWDRRGKGRDKLNQRPMFDT